MVFFAVLNKVKRISIYDIIQKTFVQVIRQIHCAFACVLLAIESDWKFYGQRRFFKINISCKDMLGAHKTLLSGCCCKNQINCIIYIQFDFFCDDFLSNLIP